MHGLREKNELKPYGGAASSTVVGIYVVNFPVFVVIYDIIFPRER